MTDAQQVRAAVEAWSYSYADEAQLQDGISEALRRAGIPHEREARIERGCIVDLLAGRVGVELKVGGSRSSVVRQLERYAASDRVDALVLVTARMLHSMPEEIGGKPVLVVCIAGAGL